MDGANDTSIPVITFMFDQYDYDGMDWPVRGPHDPISVIDQASWNI